MVREKRYFNLANIIGREKKYIWKMHHYPTGTGGEGRLTVGTACSSAGLALPGDRRKVGHTGEQGGARNPTLVYIAHSGCPCWGGTWSIPLPWHRWAPQAALPNPPDLSHTNLHIPSGKENLGLGLLWI